MLNTDGSWRKGTIVDDGMLLLVVEGFFLVPKWKSVVEPGVRLFRGQLKNDGYFLFSVGVNAKNYYVVFIITTIAVTNW